MKFKRKNLVVNPKFQLTLIGSFFFLNIGMVVINVLLYISLKNHWDHLSSYQQGISLDVVQTFVQSNADIFYRYMVLSTLFCILFSLTVGLLLSHRVAGPIYRTISVLKQIRTGPEFKAPVKLREGDFFGELELELNQMIEHTKELKQKSVQS